MQEYNRQSKQFFLFLNYSTDCQTTKEKKEVHHKTRNTVKPVKRPLKNRQNKSIKDN